MLSVKEVAEKLGVSRRLVYSEIEVGRLKCHRFGKRAYRISEEDFRNYVEASGNRIEAVTEDSADQQGRKRPVSTFKHIDVSRLLS